MSAQPADENNPLYAVTRGAEGDVIVRWSELTEAEREKAWRDYEKAFGTPASIGLGRIDGMEMLAQLGGLCGEPPVLSRDDLAERLDFLGAHNHAAEVRMMNPVDVEAAKAMWFEDKGRVQ
ncbi:hypothetical protein BSZ19_18515 [Bradyrhizobium japonicum]|uniref:Uncharacterized protein n=1 Tax=Bradyrhizobium japonicum TaxID=375 RepID=A0A1Y2JRF0_BRAJP|nr:hypothetical protein [Bradyrhizobium japonicum]OSJ32546.1 hypothetical protein BSZ19_18515 [Bradyrhizobium japonicum]